jgi:hypothetical protein
MQNLQSRYHCSSLSKDEYDTGARNRDEDIYSCYVLFAVGFGFWWGVCGKVRRLMYFGRGRHAAPNPYSQDFSTASPFANQQFLNGDSVGEDSEWLMLSLYTSKLFNDL